jgi:proteic killer suppression protein
LSRQPIRFATTKSPDYINVPGRKFHGLAGHYAITVNGNRRLTFTIEDGDAVLVNDQDSH